MVSAPIELEKSQIMFKLARKDNWGHKYDRLEHFKRFQHLDEAIKELSKINFILIYKKQKFTRISLNTEHKKQIIAFIEKELPYLKRMLR